MSIMWTSRLRGSIRESRFWWWMGEPSPAEAVKLRFEPRDERGKVVEAPAGSDGFRFSLMGSDVYDLFVTNLPNDFYLSAVRVNGALIPDPPGGRVQSYREGAADENGLFLLRGVAPGKYILVAWLDDPPCDYWDPDGLAGCRAAGRNIDVQEAEEQNVELKMKIVAKR